ncbi:hypothetical protein HPB48_012723 [Haemaphysalis longicornis]|uniref:Endonuclease/exonuclease/phosphatase domain-containing protein n=1 Tax=Haemaphysalis longicornis TaxID=44386 RepID=A0A9J6FTR4_HAELO|nr:hypothetical protein HPB48_012723 [Haemaphysalis longicornis]
MQYSNVWPRWRVPWRPIIPTNAAQSNGSNRITSLGDMPKPKRTLQWPVKTKNFHIWQWNCASFKQRRATLQQYLESQPKKPQVILLQETLCETLTIPGYRVVAAGEQGKRGLATLVSTQVSFQEHVLKINSAKLENIMIEIVPNVKWSARLFILNVYDSPSDYKHLSTR